MAELIEDARENVDYQILSIENVNQIYATFHAKPLPTPTEHKSSFSAKPFSGTALIDCGATSCFIHPDIVKEYRLPRYKHSFPKKLRVIDGREIASGQITHFVISKTQIFI